MSERGDKRTFPNTLTRIVEWNSKTFHFCYNYPYFTSQFPISPLFTTIKGVKDVAFFVDT